MFPQCTQILELCSHREMGEVKAEMQLPVTLVYTRRKASECLQGKRRRISIIREQNKSRKAESTRYKLRPDTAYSKAYVIFSQIQK